MQKGLIFSSFCFSSCLLINEMLASLLTKLLKHLLYFFLEISVWKHFNMLPLYFASYLVLEFHVVEISSIVNMAQE